MLYLEPTLIWAAEDYRPLMEKGMKIINMSYVLLV